MLPLLPADGLTTPVVLGYGGSEWALWENATFFPWDSRVDYRPEPDGRGDVVLRATSRDAASMLRRRVRLEPAVTPRVTWTWKVPALIPGAQTTVPGKDDAAARIYFFWNLERKEDLVRAYGLSYVWGQGPEPGTLRPDPGAARIGVFVLRSGASPGGTWQRESRDLRQDFRTFFGREPLGPVTLVALLTDTDQTRGRATAWYGPITATANPKED